jgi:type VI secretion system secreted protein Hcp
MPVECDYFLKISGIDGEAVDTKHKDEIQIYDFRMAVANRGRRGAYGVGKTTFDDARFFAHLDQSYPKLELACNSGEHLGSAILTCRKQGKLQQEYLKITLSDIVVTSCNLVTEAEQLLPSVEFTIGFSKQMIEYREQKQDGSLGGAMVATVDLKKNTAVSA